MSHLFPSDFNDPVDLDIKQLTIKDAARYVNQERRDLIRFNGIRNVTIVFSDTIDLDGILMSVFPYKLKAKSLTLVLADGAARAKPLDRIRELVERFPSIRALSIEGELEYAGMPRFLADVNRHHALTFLRVDAIADRVSGGGEATRACIARFIGARAANPRCAKLEGVQINPAVWPTRPGDPIVTACAKHGCRLTTRTSRDMIESRLVYEATVAYRRGNNPVIDAVAGVLPVEGLPELVSAMAVDDDVLPYVQWYGFDCPSDADYFRACAK
jgi:hypothetical protein